MGGRLLTRGRHGVQLTEAGRALVPHARAALAAVEEGRRAVAEVTGLQRGEVRIGGGATACTYLLPPYVARFRADHPGIRFVLRELRPDDLEDALAAGTVDLGVVTGPGQAPWLDDELVLVGPPGATGHGGPFVSFPPGSTTRSLLLKHIPDADIVMELSGIAAVKSNVRAGVGLALLSRSAVANDLADGRLVRVPHPATPVRRSMSLRHRGEARLSPATAALIRVLLEPR